MCVCVYVCVCVCNDPDGGLVRPEGLLLIEPAEEALLDGIPRAREERKKISQSYINMFLWAMYKCSLTSVA